MAFRGPECTVRGSQAGGDLPASLPLDPPGDPLEGRNAGLVELLPARTQPAQPPRIGLRLRAQRLASEQGSAVYLNNLAYALTERGLLLERALEMALEANELTDYRDPNYVDTLAWALYQLGSYEAAEALMAPLAEAFDEPIFDYHFGAILLGVGRTTDGQEAIERAIAGGLDWWNRQAAERLLEHLSPTA